VQRNDDKKEAIETRLKVYDEQTAPLISFYQKKALLSDLVSVGPIDSVFGNLTKVLTTHKIA
jgi:adenylate kinase